MTEQPEYLLPWKSIREAKRVCLEKEFHTEVSEGHPLWGKEVTAIAAREDNDEVLFIIQDHDAHETFAVVFLTWIREQESEGRPIVIPYENFQDFRDQDMVPNHQKYSTI